MGLDKNTFASHAVDFATSMGGAGETLLEPSY